jgi:hypothetical protein
MKATSRKKHFGKFRLSASSATGWQEWPSPQGISIGERQTRYLGPGEQGRISLAIAAKQRVAIVLRFSEDFRRAEAGLCLRMNGQPIVMRQNHDFPKLAWGQLNPATNGHTPLESLIIRNKGTMDRIAIAEILVLPVRKPRPTHLRASIWRFLAVLNKGKPPSDYLASFPYCYFNAYAYYCSNPEAGYEMYRLNYPHLAEYYYRKGRASGHEMELSYENPPSLGTLSQVLRWAAKMPKKTRSKQREELSSLLRGFDTGPDNLAIQLENDRLRRQLDHFATKGLSRADE